MLEMSLEEKALIHADKFFSGPEKWLKGGNALNGKLCIGMAMLRGAGAVDCTYWPGTQLRPTCTPEQLNVVIHALNLGHRSGHIISWNDYQCPSYAALKAKLAERILFYQNQRLKDSYIVIFGPGRQVKG